MTDHRPRKCDIDFDRRVVRVAFLNDANTDGGGVTRLPAEDRVDEQFDLERGGSVPYYNNNKERRSMQWRGVFFGLKEALRSVFTHNYAQKRCFAHCELCFDLSQEGKDRYGDQYMIACGAQEGSGVKMVARRFNKSYTWLTLTVSVPEMHLIVNFAFSQHGKRYDSPATYKIHTWPRETTGASWYCSELVLCALQMIPCDILHSRRTNCVDVDDVYTLMSASSRISRSQLNVTPIEVKKVTARKRSNGLDVLCHSSSRSDSEQS